MHAAGRISDGPGDYGNYSKGITFGKRFQALKAIYTPVVGGGGSIGIVFASRTFENLMDYTSHDAWALGKVLRFFPSENSAASMVSLAAHDGVITALDQRAHTVTISTALVLAEVVEIGEGMVGQVGRVIDSVCFPDGGGCIAVPTCVCVGVCV